MSKFIPELLVYDFDGVMTDNRALVFEDGTEAVFVNRSDGYGISELKKAGYKQLILSTEKNKVVTARAKKLLIDVIQNSKDKLEDLKGYCDANEIQLKKVAYVGNDLNDLEVMKNVGYSIAPNDAILDILCITNHTTIANGGDGVIKEIADELLRDKCFLFFK